MAVEFRHLCEIGETQEYVLISDLHLDHPKTDQKRVWRFMDAAQKRGAKFLINGDTLCIMQGRNDKRGSKSEVRPEHQSTAYFDAVAIDIAQRLAPYAANIAYIGDGNHETAVIKHNEVDVLGHMIHRLNTDHGGQVVRGGYHGYLIMRFTDTSGGGTRTHVIYHHHGKYGGEVTKGALGVNRYAAIHPSANTVWSGHTHDAWYIEHPQMHLLANGEVVTKSQYHIKTGTAKDEFNVPGGFGVERLNKPAALTMWSMTMGRVHDDGKAVLNIQWQPMHL